MKFSKDIVVAINKMPTGTEISQTLNRALFDGEHTGGNSINYNPDDTVVWDPSATFCVWTSNKKIISCTVRSSKSDSVEDGMSLVHQNPLIGGLEDE